jgi:hypothetical protein
LLCLAALVIVTVEYCTDRARGVVLTIIWYTDHDRQDMLAAREERAFLDELEFRAAHEQSDATDRPLTPRQIAKIENLQIDPRPRLQPPPT